MEKPVEIPCTNKVICLSKPPRSKSLSSKLNVGNNCEQTFTCLPHVCALKYISGNMLPERGGGRGAGRVLGPYMAYTGMCCWTGVVFVLSVLGYIITRDSDLNRVCKERTIRKLIGGGARARRSTNKVFAQEKIK